MDLKLMNGFELLDGEESVRFPLSVQRLIAFLALQERPVQRVYVAGKLWLHASEQRAFASLRSALWRAGNQVIRSDSTRLALDPDVSVDLRDATLQARRLIAGTADDVTVAGFALTGEILPDWYDDWLLLEREAHRQLRLHALEALASRLTGQGRYAEAVDAALAAVMAEPLRESAHRTLIAVHLAEDNPTEAMRQYDLYRAMLAAEIGIAPSPRIAALVDGLMTPR